jgi:hypothetical protein
VAVRADLLLHGAVGCNVGGSGILKEGMTPTELLEACVTANQQGGDFLPLVLRKARRSDGYRVRALGQLCEVLCVNSEGGLVVRVNASKTIAWLQKQMDAIEQDKLLGK